MRDPAGKAMLGSSTNTHHLYFDFQKFVYSFVQSAQQSWYHRGQIGSFFGVTWLWRFLVVTCRRCVVCRFSFSLLLRFIINRKNQFLVIRSTAKTNELDRMNEAAHQVVIWINHSRSHAQEKAPADGKTEVLRYRDTRRKDRWGRR